MTTSETILSTLKSLPTLMVPLEPTTPLEALFRTTTSPQPLEQASPTRKSEPPALEQKVAPTFLDVSPRQTYLAARPVLIEAIVEMGKSLGFHNQTTFVACGLLDKFMLAAPQNNVPFPFSKLSKSKSFLMAALACMLIAAKAHHHEEVIPTPVQLLAMASGQHPSLAIQELFQFVEQSILASVDGKVSTATPLSFAKHFLAQILPHQLSTVHACAAIPTENLVAEYELYRQVVLVLGIALRHSEFLAFRASQLGAAAVLFALASPPSMLLDGIPEPALLEKVFGYDLHHDLDDVFERLRWRHHEFVRLQAQSSRRPSSAASCSSLGPVDSIPPALPCEEVALPPATRNEVADVVVQSLEEGKEGIVTPNTNAEA